jgi:L-asparaginase/Glu-tRNA(Gln) amidotransferase subunit D
MLIPVSTRGVADENSWPQSIMAAHLTPQKARILLMLALTRTSDELEIRQLFKRY